MSSQNEEDPWDFTPVIDLNDSLSSKWKAYTRNITSSSPSSEDLPTPGSADGLCEGGAQLGNFDKIWEFLGQPHDILPPVVPPSPDDTLSLLAESARDQEETLFELSFSKGVRWRDEDGETRLADELETLVVGSAPQLSKARKKKLRIKKKRAQLLTQGEARSKLLVSDSEAETDNDAGDAPSLRNRSSVIHKFIHGTTPERKTTDHSACSATKSERNGLESAKQELAAHRYPLRSLFKAPEAPSKSTFRPPQLSLGDIASRKNKLIATLHDRFVSERTYLNNLGVTSFTENTPVIPETGLHVFIDASNVRITSRIITLYLADKIADHDWPS